MSQSSNTPERSDEELLKLFRAGNASAFDALVHRYEGELFGYLNRYLRNRELAEDTFQTTFMTVYQKAETFEEGKRFKPWLYAIATNQAIDASRKRKRRQTISLENEWDSGESSAKAGSLRDVLESNNEKPDSSAMMDEKKVQVRKAIDTLPENLRQVLLLAYFHEFKYQEISEVLEIPLGTVKSRLHAALEKFQQSWERMQDMVS
ncbi:MAG: sigma-70 family RNA polymerase sigma factor [Planctomycetota bacterium]|nr:sigma-70 family RNA polymerase sigma factor [Gemmataceae bacterium]NBS88977.1 sigma-70 family RNA polymerase sigma factor [bacterium]NBT62424.1 sigma-70 family RNA polymerase sigma factor [Planctomycetia bacterium]RLS55493.1 MAG: sigma-70 family RNA polymerase sigma factor [Planctomycetota bacterium]RLS89413.1 MAG: sigma-70 family RNA polymerase sigma factor [Planctomycetota bacterium]